ncbi:MAG: patatin-like phospholipase family protein [Lentimicrobiaceae bacterium]|nr:patatin-like phospholipase family protein [Lentimicrobiaceae bacterium]
MSGRVRILSIDGGGIRGLIPAVILADIERRIQEKTGNEQAKLTDYFDMIAGTSTGGILACFYLMPSLSDKGSCRYFAREAISLYKEHGEKIFKLKKKPKILSKMVGAAYSETGLETILTEKLSDVKLSDVKKACLITSYDIVKRGAVLFTAPVREKGKDYFLKDIARSTSAAPTYFEPAKINSIGGDTVHYLIDGGMYANDPTMCALVEARKHTFPNCQRPKFKDMYVVSVGTGEVKKEYDSNKVKKWGLISWIEPVIDIMMSSSAEVVSYQVDKIFDAVDCPENYVRLMPNLREPLHSLKPDLCDAKPEMDDVSPKNIIELEKAGMTFVNNNNELLDKIVAELIKN